MIKNYIIKDTYKKLGLEIPISLSNNYISIDDKLINMDKIITISIKGGNLQRDFFPYAF